MFLSCLLKAERDLRQEEKRKKAPMQDKEDQKTKVERRLKYAKEDAETRTNCIRKIRKREADDDEDEAQIAKVLSFISRLRWTTEKSQEGGITWLEIYAWYRMHSERKPPAPLARKVVLLEESSAIKKRVRKIGNLSACTRTMPGSCKRATAEAIVCEDWRLPTNMRAFKECQG